MIHYRRFIALLWLFGPLSLFAQQAIQVADIWQNGSLQTKGLPGFYFLKDGVHFSRLNGGAIERCDLRSGEKTDLIFDAASVVAAAPGWKGVFDAYAFNADETALLLATETESIYRRSSKSQFFIYDLRSKTLARLHEGGKQRFATFSPDGRKVAFILDNDLYYKDLSSGKTVRASRDGKINEIINGAADWVYEEEFEIARAYEWSPDGQKIAFLRFDEREVPEMTMERYTGAAYPEQVKYKYPKVGEKNAVVSAHIYDLASGQTTAAAAGANADDYLPRIQWTPGGELCITKMNRHQNWLQLLLANPATGACRLLFEEKNKYYLDLQEPSFLADGSGFIWQSEKSGFNHLYRYDMNGKETAALTKGDWDVTTFYGVDERSGQLYYQAAAVKPTQREVYSVQLSGKKRKKVSAAPGFNGAQFSATFDYFIHSFSTANTPPQYAVCDRKGKTVRLLEQNEALRQKQSDHAAQPMEFFSFKTSENVSLNGWMIKPAGTPPDAKLPVLMFVYGGPGSQQVLDQWKGANYWWFQMLAQQGYVVACVDNRGTGARGEAFKKMTYLKLGQYETQDQIEAAKYLGTLPFVDKTRIGIQGGSYGGYMASLCLLKGDGVFNSAVAVAPVTHWKWYDSIYTERYMRTEEENPEGYKDFAPVLAADKLKGNYLLVHGLTDDNVHFQHSAEMSNQLVAANKQFDAMIYPNRNHGISDAKAKTHLHTMMLNFLNEKLKGAKNDGARP